MNIAVIGTGKMARGIARRLARGGARFVIGSRELERASKLAKEIGPMAAAGRMDEVVTDAEIILLAVPYAAVGDVLASLGPVDGKVVIDITNPLTPDYMGLTIGHTTSAAEEIQALAPKAKVVKAFNTIFAEIFDTPVEATRRVPVFIAGDDMIANEIAAEFVRKVGFDPVYSGALSNARFIEPLAELNIHFGYALQKGTSIAPTWMKIGA